jgi:hypothetical protein
MRLSGRLCLWLGLFWFLPGLSFTAVGVCLVFVKVDPGRLFWVLLTTLMMACGLWLWRAFVAWTMGRVLGTVTASAVVLGQAVAWIPLWNAGCVTVDFLRFGQSSGLAGLWLMGMTYAWWGAGAGVAQWRKRTMSTNARRIVFGIGLIPFVSGVWLMLAITLAEFVFTNIEWRAVMVAHAVGAALIVVAWTFAWWKEVVRSRRTVAWTIAAAATYVGLATAAAPLMHYDESSWYFIIWLAGPLMLTGVWFAATALLWTRGSAAAVAGPIDVNAALRCSACGYSLIGLSEARCPECGRKQTLDELFSEIIAMQPDV